MLGAVFNKPILYLSNLLNFIVIFLASASLKTIKCDLYSILGIATALITYVVCSAVIFFDLVILYI